MWMNVDSMHESDAFWSFPFLPFRPFPLFSLSFLYELTLPFHPLLSPFFLPPDQHRALFALREPFILGWLRRVRSYSYAVSWCCCCHYSLAKALTLSLCVFSTLYNVKGLDQSERERTRTREKEREKGEEEEKEDGGLQWEKRREERPDRPASCIWPIVKARI